MAWSGTSLSCLSTSPNSRGRLRTIAWRSLDTLAGHRQQHVGVLVEFGSEAPDGGLGRGRHLVALDLAQVGWLDADALGHLACGECPVLTPKALADRTDVATECHVYYIVPTNCDLSRIAAHTTRAAVAAYSANDVWPGSEHR